MIEKTIEISGIPVRFKSSAAVPRLYRSFFGRDIFRDLAKLEKTFSKADPDSSLLSDDLELFEDIAYIMAKHADPDLPDIMIWLTQFQIFSIYEILPDLLELWGANMETQIESKKNLMQVSGR